MGQEGERGNEVRAGIERAVTRGFQSREHRLESQRLLSLQAAQHAQLYGRRGKGMGCTKERRVLILDFPSSFFGPLPFHIVLYPLAQSRPHIMRITRG